MNSRMVVMAIAAMFFGFVNAYAEKSLWQKFKDFFNPGQSVDCEEGAVCNELHQVESQINKTEGKYSRERRPASKDRYKRELDSLNLVRDSLVAVIESKDSLRGEVSSSSAQALSSERVCKTDTVYVRDTIRIHDTLYVMLAPKPEDDVAKDLGDSLLEEP